MNEHVFQRVSVLMGGVSEERAVSLSSGAAVAEGLRLAGREVVEVDVLGRDFDLPPDTDAVFIALHGGFGEDGRVQEILEERRMPYTGSGPRSSWLAFNKILAKELFFAHDIPTPNFEVLRSGQRRSLDLPVAVKPVLQGSSFGMHRVTRESDWDAALEDALSYHGEVIVEPWIEGRELTVGVVCSEALPVLEIRAPGNNYDYRAKYTKGVTEYIVPAELDARSTLMCRRIALKTFEVLGCRGFGRVDMRMSADGSVYVLELNTIPGFTPTSLLPKSAAAAGYGFSDLCDRIIQSASLDLVALREEYAEVKNVVE